MKAYDFAPNEDVGMFVHDSFLLPTGGKIESMGSSLNYSYSNADHRSHLGLMLGPAYKTNVNDITNFYLGIGPSFHQFIVNEYPNAIMCYMIGLGVDVGLHILSSEKGFMNLGVLADYNFANYTDLNGSGEWTTDYSFASIRPYFGFGFVL